MTSADDIRKRALRLEKEAYYEFFETVLEAAGLIKELDPIERRPVLAAVVNELFEKQQGKCALCSGPLKLGKHEVDHVIPLCYGGGNESSNLQLTCISCNRKKGKSVDAEALLRYLQDRAQNLASPRLR